MSCNVFTLLKIRKEPESFPLILIQGVMGILYPSSSTQPAETETCFVSVTFMSLVDERGTREELVLSCN